MSDDQKLTANQAFSGIPTAIMLDGPMQLLVDTYAALHPQAAHLWNELDIIGGALVENVQPAALHPDALSSVLSQLDAIDEADGAHRRAAEQSGAELQEVLGLPEPAREAALDALTRGTWRQHGRGIRALELVRDNGATAELLRIEPGCGAPTHGHGGGEFTLVLAGAFHDGRQRYGRGDVCVAGADDVHRPIAEPGEVCFALAVTDAPLQFRGVLGVLQKVMGRA